MEGEALLWGLPQHLCSQFSRTFLLWPHSFQAIERLLWPQRSRAAVLQASVTPSYAGTPCHPWRSHGGCRSPLQVTKLPPPFHSLGRECSHLPRAWGTWPKGAQELAGTWAGAQRCGPTWQFHHLRRPELPSPGSPPQPGCLQAFISQSLL